MFSLITLISQLFDSYVFSTGYTQINNKKNGLSRLIYKKRKFVIFGNWKKTIEKNQLV